MRGRAALGDTAGGAVAPLTTQGSRLAPVGLVPELALGALRTMERQLGRLVICAVAAKRSSSSGHQTNPHSTQHEIRATCSALRLLILGRRPRCPDCRRVQGNEAPDRQSNRQVHSVPAPHSPESVVGLFLYSAWLRSRNLREFPHDEPCHDGEAPEAPTFPRGGVAGRSTDYRPPAPRPGRYSRP